MTLLASAADRRAAGRPVSVNYWVREKGGTVITEEKFVSRSTGNLFMLIELNNSN